MAMEREARAEQGTRPGRANLCIRRECGRRLLAMSSMISFCTTVLLSAVNEKGTVHVREALAAALPRDPTENEVAAARRAARRIAEGGTAVLMSLYPSQGRSRGKDGGRGEREVLHLTVDEELIMELPYRVEVATDRWQRAIEEGKRRTEKMIDNDPVLSYMLRPADPSQPRGTAGLIAHLARLHSEAEVQGVTGR